tara:strand:+ start:146 stop:349 length:204 start_codon:yes stop_codon:yes gene_type:complete
MAKTIDYKPNKGNEQFKRFNGKKIAQGEPGSGVKTNENMDKTLKRLGIKKEDLEKHQTSGMGQRWKI